MSVDGFIRVCASEEVPQDLETLFRRKYRDSLPRFPHHVAAYYRVDDGSEIPVCYAHFTDRNPILLGGGACVDNRVLRRMREEERVAVHAAGGLYHHVLAWSVRHFAPRFAAIFGYCGDALAERIDRAVGFESTIHARLLVYWTRALDAHQRAELVEQANSCVPF